MTTTFYIILAVIPSIIWLLFYLRKDKHPEPNRIIIKIFFCGILATLAALVLEFLYAEALKSFSLSEITILIIGGTAFIEEYLKYFVVKIKVLKNSEFDEPVDAMIYLIIAALGFAAAENILLLNGLSLAGATTEKIIEVVLIRFVSAVLIHALASGILGYFLARSFMLKSKRERKSLIGLGLITAASLHGIYNYIILNIRPNNESSVIFLIILIGLMAIGVSLAFKKLSKIKSICKSQLKI